MFAYALLAVLSFTTPGDAKAAYADYDKVRDETTVTLLGGSLTAKNGQPPNTVDVVAVVCFDGEPDKPRVKQAGGVVLRFQCESRRWTYLRAHDFAAFADGVRFTSKPTHAGRLTDNGGVVESVGVFLSSEEAARLSSGKDVAIAIGPDEFQLTSAVRGQIAYAVGVAVDPTTTTNVVRQLNDRLAELVRKEREKISENQKTTSRPAVELAADEWVAGLESYPKVRNAGVVRAWHVNAIRRICAKYSLKPLELRAAVKRYRPDARVVPVVN